MPTPFTSRGGDRGVIGASSRSSPRRSAPRTTSTCSNIRYPSRRPRTSSSITRRCRQLPRLGRQRRPAIVRQLQRVDDIATESQSREPRNDQQLYQLIAHEQRPSGAGRKDLGEARGAALLGSDKRTQQRLVAGESLLVPAAGARELARQYIGRR